MLCLCVSVMLVVFVIYLWLIVIPLHGCLRGLILGLLMCLFVVD